MVLSYYLYTIPYKMGWIISGWMKKRIPLAFYCSNPHDYYAFEPVRKHLPPCRYIAKNNAIKEFLAEKGIQAERMPVFPEAVIMAFHAAHKFSAKSIIKIGMRHGPYHFKSMISADKYNRFHTFFVTSEEEVRQATELGIHTARNGGYPRLDPAFDGSISPEYLKQLAGKAGFKENRKIILFSATWDGSGMSAIDKWLPVLEQLTQYYNIAVTVHHWMSSHYITRLKNISGIIFIHNEDVLPWQMLADVMIGDTSSIIGEFCALNKPIITFRVQTGKRLNPEVVDMLEKISYRIEDAAQLKATIDTALAQPEFHQEERMRANRKMFGILDGKHGQRMAQEILKIIGTHS